MAEDAAARSDGAEPAQSGKAESCLVGGQSFTAGTKVLTATGALVAISKLKPGQKVLATSTRTGRTQAEPVAAVLVRYDKDLYDLKVRAGSKTSVINTTRSHLFWNQTSHRWTKAGALKYGTHLRTPSGGTAAVLSGYTPRVTTGWMWDLTIPTDHDFYIRTSITAILVHNVNRSCGDAPEDAGAADLPGYSSFRAAKADLGPAGPGNVYDHVVERSQIARSGFAPQEVHNPFNLDPVLSAVNQLKANYYSSIRPFTNGVTVP